MDLMPARPRAMIAMRDIQELSYAEIAGFLDLPEGTVKSRINRARLHLRGIFLGLEELKDYIDVKYNNE
jgi:RNA polymerase sigma-70 factor (ECF subfamily)